MTLIQNDPVPGNVRSLGALFCGLLGCFSSFTAFPRCFIVAALLSPESLRRAQAHAVGSQDNAPLAYDSLQALVSLGSGCVGTAVVNPNAHLGGPALELGLPHTDDGDGRDDQYRICQFRVEEASQEGDHLYR